MKQIIKSIMIILITLLFTAGTDMSVNHIQPSNWGNRQNDIKTSGILGFGLLYRIPGLWNGPVISDTPAGDYPVWYVDFRPVSSSQISEFSIVDSSLSNYITFFIVKHENRLKLAIRTDARFMNEGCITYEVIQEADEKKGYYKFADFQSGTSRAYTVFQFSENEFEMMVYTNKFNQLREPELHSRWEAKRITMEPAVEAIETLNYPQAKMACDFSDIFGNMHESIFFDTEKAPYKAEDEPYVGSINFNITIDENLTVSPADEIFLMLTTEPIFEGLTYFPDRLNYISKFVYLSSGTENFTMTHIHPGTYYLYSYNDINGDKLHKSGDYMSSKLEHIITVGQEKPVEVNTHIDYVIP